MTVDFVRFNASDDVELQGWFNDAGGDVVAIHIHGMSGNGYENYFLDNLREMYTGNGISFFTINTRGHGIVSDFRQRNTYKRGGSCYELFEESVSDIQGAINYLKSIGKKRFILQGHSLGGSKVVNFLTTQNIDEFIAAILLAPTDMVGWASTDSNNEAYLAKSKELLAENKGEELVGAQCWLDKTPLSAQTYPSICEAGSSADIYGDREGGALLGNISIPMLICYGSNDIGIEKIDGSIDAWLSRVTAIKNENTAIEIIENATHGFKPSEAVLAKTIERYIEKQQWQ